MAPAALAALVARTAADVHCRIERAVSAAAAMAHAGTVTPAACAAAVAAAMRWSVSAATPVGREWGVALCGAAAVTSRALGVDQGRGGGDGGSEMGR